MNLYFFITCTNLFSPYITFHSAERNKLNTVLHMLSTFFPPRWWAAAAAGQILFTAMLKKIGKVTASCILSLPLLVSFPYPIAALSLSLTHSREPSLSPHGWCLTRWQGLEGAGGPGCCAWWIGPGSRRRVRLRWQRRVARRVRPAPAASRAGVGWHPVSGAASGGGLRLRGSAMWRLLLPRGGPSARSARDLIFNFYLYYMKLCILFCWCFFGERRGKIVY